MAIEESPIYEALIQEIGSPIQVPAMDCSYAAVIEMAGYKADRSSAAAQPAAEAAIPAPAKLTPRAQKPLASVARKNAS
jgi:hypothetical protein